MAADQLPDKEKLISETRQRFTSEYVQDKAEKYDSRDIERLKQDNVWVESYLQWRHYNVDESLKMIDESFQWRKEFSVHDLSESSLPKWTFETGAVYLHGYDKEGNKIFWFRVKLHNKDTKTALEKKKYVAFWLERYSKREHGKPLTVVFDLTETGISNVDMDFVRFIIYCFKIYYPKYLSKMVIYEMPWIMNAAWKIVKSWLGPDALSMLKFANKTEVQEYINVEYLPTHMGGTDPFKYSYPPLPDDDFQTPICENGPIPGEDEVDVKEKGDGDCKDTVDTNHSEESLQKTKKVTFEIDRSDMKSKSVKKPQTMFRGSLLHISPAEDIHFGCKESGETKCLIVLTNVTRNPVAFKVRTTAPDKYRVKPSNGSFEPGTSMDILVSLHGGVEASPQDRFLVMAAEMNQAAGAAAPPDLSQFWKEVARDQVMEHRLRCHVVESSKASAVAKENLIKGHVAFSNQDDLHSKINKLMVSNRHLEERIDRCLFFLQLLTIMVAFLVIHVLSWHF
ncbi:motile sperm domain-containing protein 2 isoform X1 [Hypanus sabinus]|uniref:motile sperm domain-containing protein 2 isoform X1 n=2 Tax=Hypanus sabinus TaxID=79690 RepID=UPI0028C3D9C4|nr:motile sperm domain-containing protein 2 isoform X1 [Hypanus sabinus]